MPISPTWLTLSFQAAPTHSCLPPSQIPHPIKTVISLCLVVQGADHKTPWLYHVFLLGSISHQCYFSFSTSHCHACCYCPVLAQKLTIGWQGTHSLAYGAVVRWLVTGQGSVESRPLPRPSGGKVRRRPVSAYRNYSFLFDILNFHLMKGTTALKSF